MTKLLYLSVPFLFFSFPFLFALLSFALKTV